MTDLPLSQDMVDFAVKVALATYRGKLAWETTADEDKLIAPLGGPFTAMVERTWDTDSDGDAFRTYELVLLKAGDEIFRLAPGPLTGTDFAKRVDRGTNAYGVFEQVWTRALLMAKKVTEELVAVNRLLDATLGRAADTDDDEVPF